MQIDLTPEEINLITECVTKPQLAFNREQMIAFVNQTAVILQKFQTAINPITPATPSSEENTHGE